MPGRLRTLTPEEALSALEALEAARSDSSSSTSTTNRSPIASAKAPAASSSTSSGDSSGAQSDAALATELALYISSRVLSDPNQAHYAIGLLRTAAELHLPLPSAVVDATCAWCGRVLAWQEDQPHATAPPEEATPAEKGAWPLLAAKHLVSFLKVLIDLPILRASGTASTPSNDYKLPEELHSTYCWAVERCATAGGMGGLRGLAEAVYALHDLGCRPDDDPEWRAAMGEAFMREVEAEGDSIRPQDASESLFMLASCWEGNWTLLAALTSMRYSQRLAAQGYAPEGGQGQGEQQQGGDEAEGQEEEEDWGRPVDFADVLILLRAFTAAKQPPSPVLLGQVEAMVRAHMRHAGEGKAAGAGAGAGGAVGGELIKDDVLAEVLESMLMMNHNAGPAFVQVRACSGAGAGAPWCLLGPGGRMRLKGPCGPEVCMCEGVWHLAACRLGFLCPV